MPAHRGRGDGTRARSHTNVTVLSPTRADFADTIESGRRSAVPEQRGVPAARSTGAGADGPPSYTRSRGEAGPGPATRLVDGDLLARHRRLSRPRSRS